MMATSTAFLEAAKALNRTPQARVIVNGITYTNIDLTSVTVQSGSIVEDNFQIGSVVSDSVTVEFPKIITTLHQLDDVVIEMGFNDEYVTLGHFKIYPNVSVSKNDHSTKFEAYDILSFMADTWSSNLVYPASPYNIMAEIANKYGVVIANANLLNELDGISEFRLPKLDDKSKYSNREVLGFIAGLVSGYIKINRSGALEIRRLPISGSSWNESVSNSNAFEIRPDEYFLKGLEIQGKKFTVHGLTAKVSNENSQTVITSGSKKGKVLEVENPWITQELLNSMYEKVKNIAFYPYSLNWRGNPALEAGDVISVYDVEGTKHYVPNLSYELSFNGGLRALSSASSEASSETISNPPSLINRLRDDVNAALTKSAEALGSANGKNTNYYSEDEPPVTPLSRAGDLWFKKDGDKTEMWQLKLIDGVLKWELVISEQSQEEFEEKLQKELDDAKKELDEALAEKDEDIAFAMSQIESVQAVVDEAKAQANSAVAKADGAVAGITTALQQAQNAYAKSVKSSVVTYQAGTSGTSVPTGTWTTTIPTVSASQYLWTRTIFTLQDDTATTSYAVSKQGENGAPGANAPTITKVQDQIYLSTSNTTQSGGAWGTSVPIWSSGKYYWSRVATTFDTGVIAYSTPVLDAALNQALVSTLEVQTTAAALQTTISQHATQIQLKASQSAVDGLSGRLSTAETTISQHAGQIQLKASQSTVDSLTGRVTISESQITQQAGLITSLVTDLATSELATQSQITQLATDINLRVTKNDVINQINLSNEGVLISASKLTIDVAGNLLMNSEFTSTDFFDGWTQSGSLTDAFYNSVDFYSDTMGARSYSVGIDSKSGTSANWRRLNQDVAAREGVPYSASAIMRTASQTDNCGIAINLAFLDDNKATLSSSTSAWKTTSEHSKVTIENVIAPAGTKYIRFAVVAKGITNSYATRLMLNRGAKVAPYNASTGAVYVSGNMIVDGAVTAVKLTANAVTADKIAASAVTAAKIAAGSITADKISVSSLSALSANLGTITAGTINASTVNIINLNAANITTGTLNAARIGANTITADKINATSLQLFSNDEYLKVTASGIIASNRAQLIFANWKDSSGAEIADMPGVYLGGRNSGNKFVAFTRANGTTFMIRAESSMDYGSNANIATNALNIFDTVHNQGQTHLHGAVRAYGSLYLGASGSLSIQPDISAATMNFRVSGGTGNYFWFNNKIISSDGFASSSRLSLKDVDGSYRGDALADICQTDIVAYRYKNSPNDKQLSPIIDDVNDVKKYHIPDIINDGKTVNLYAMSSLSWLAIQQMAEKIKKLEEKLNACA